jgi:hypothetical protein
VTIEGQSERRKTNRKTTSKFSVTEDGVSVQDGNRGDHEKCSDSAYTMNEMCRVTE